MNPLDAFVASALERPVAPSVARAAALLAAEFDGVAVLFYGSVLRSGALGDVLDFYVLTTQSRRARLWPDVHYRELTVVGATLRAKVATLPLAAFAAMADGRTRDTTIWTRFVQPAALVWSADPAATTATVQAVAAAARTAARFAALHGPAQGIAADYWHALFRATYATELRFEAPGREATIVAAEPGFFTRLLPLAWMAGGIAFDESAAALRPRLADRAAVARAWRRVALTGRALNVARLVKAAFTFDGAAAYALYKVGRHTGVMLPLTPWRARHPILAAPGVLWQVWRAR